MRSSFYGLATAADRLWPAQFCQALAIRSRRTLDRYLKLPGFPQGVLERVGRIAVRTFSSTDLGVAQVWLAQKGLPGPRAGQRRRENLERARTARGEERDLLQLAGRVLISRGATALVDAMRPMGFDRIGWKQIARGHRMLVRAALVRAMEGH